MSDEEATDIYHHIQHTVVDIQTLYMFDVQNKYSIEHDIKVVLDEFRNVSNFNQLLIKYSINKSIKILPVSEICTKHILRVETNMTISLQTIQHAKYFSVLDQKLNVLFANSKDYRHIKIKINYQPFDPILLQDIIFMLFSLLIPMILTSLFFHAKHR